MRHPRLRQRRHGTTMRHEGCEQASTAQTDGASEKGAGRGMRVRNACVGGKMMSLLSVMTATTHEGEGAGGGGNAGG
jgi:hypothetical protein